MIEPLKTGAHIGKIAPFQFHSETEMEEKAKEVFEKIKKYKWSFLLIDDFAYQGLREHKNSNNFGSTTKIEILKQTINENIIGTIDYALYINNTDKLKKEKDLKEESAIDKINKKRYDIILLDFLFSNEEIFQKQQYEYGTDFLDLIKNNKISKNKGIKDKYWIFPVSVFNTALLSDMLRKGYEYYTKDWYFSPGADPINTPNLFKYKLYHFLELQTKYFPFKPTDLMKVLLKFKDIVLKNDTNEKNTEIELKKYAYKTMPFFLESYGFIFEITSEKGKNMSEFFNTIKNDIKKEITNKENEFFLSSYTLAEEIRNFLNYAYNPIFQRNLLLNSFIKLNEYKEKIYEKCHLEETEKKELDNLFDALIDKIIILK